MSCRLVSGNLNYSSWTLRAWLGLTAFGIPFGEDRIPLFEGDWRRRIDAYVPSGTVPILLHDGITIMESLAILETLAERFPERVLWPTDAAARARARMLAAEMHAGFHALRSHLPMNMRRHYPGYPVAEEARRDIDLLARRWDACRQEHGQAGPFLFGPFTIADCMFAPVVSRLVTYDVRLDGAAGHYMDAVQAHPAYRAAMTAAKAEPWAIPRYEFD